MPHLQVQLGASQNHVETEQEVSEGVRLFPDLNIVVKVCATLLPPSVDHVVCCSVTEFILASHSML